MITGHCLCGGVRFRITAQLAPIQICHCSQCRRAQGAAFASNIPVAEADFHLDSGAELIRAYESSPGKHRCFCQCCGSPLYSHTLAVPGVLRIRAGLLDEPIAARPIAHFYTGSKASWWAIHDELPQFPQAYQPR